LQKQGAKKLVLDLRHCATGGPEQGEKIAELFLDKGQEITYTQGQKSPRADVTADGIAVNHLPLVVVVNRGTADGAEVAAAALLDDKRADVVGEKTYGDASIRKTITMDDGSAVILSTAKFYSPSGKAIQDTGVSPSVPVVEAEAATVDDDGNPIAAEPQQPKEDLLLKKAIEVITKGKSDVAAAPGAQSGDSSHAPALTPLNVPHPQQQQ